MSTFVLKSLVLEGQVLVLARSVLEPRILVDNPEG